MNRVGPWLVAVAGIGLAVRAIPIVLTDFPVNDGGLFVAMTRAIQDAGWTLPATVAWNGADLPFTYPPLAFYVAGLLESIGLDLFAVFRWAPLVFAALVVPAVYLLARELLRSDIGALVAALAYALTPVAYVWLIGGGGVTRAPGMLLAVLALWQLVRLVRSPSRGRAVTVGVLFGLTALVHPGAAVFVATGSLLVWLVEGRTRLSLAAIAAAVGIGLVVATPWLFPVINQQGLASLFEVPSNGPSPIDALVAVAAGRVTGVPFLDPLSVLGFALAILSLVRRRWLLPAWFAVSLLLSYQYAMVPFALLIGTAAVDLAALWSSRDPTASGPARWVPLAGVAVLAAALVVEGVASALTVLNPEAPVHALDADRREAMAWVDTNLEPDATVALITNSVWSGDPDSEWFPLLADRVSVATVQGSEWLGREAFPAQQQVHDSLQRCVSVATVACVADWLAEHPAGYLYLPFGQIRGPSSPSDCCAELRAELLADDRFEPVLEGPGATVLAVRDPALSRAVAR
jgi:hypothetical protein